MRALLLGVMIGCTTLTVSGQVRTGPHSSVTNPGFGNILFPGMPPGASPTGTLNNAIGFPGRLGATVAGRPYGGNRPAARYVQPNGGTVIVPYAYPVYVAGDSGYYQQPQAPAQDQQAVVQQQPAPMVIINQNFSPEMLRPQVREYPPADGESSMRMYQAPPAVTAPPPASASAEADRPSLYIIAFKDGTMYSAVGYAVEGDTIRYVTPKGVLNRASIDSIDLPTTQQMNRERGMEFTIH